MRARRRGARRNALMASVAAAVVVVPSVVTTVRGVPAVVSAACSYCAGGEYHPVTPVRIFDSRNRLNDVAPLGAKPVGNRTTASFDVQLLGIGVAGFVNAYLPPWVAAGDVLGVMASVVVIQPTVGGHLTAVPKGANPATGSSVLNFPAGRTIANLTLARPGADGKLSIGLFGGGAGTAHVLIDVYGWFSSSSYVGQDGSESLDERGGRMVPVTATRVFDSVTTVGPKSVSTVKIRGAVPRGAASPVLVPDAPGVVGAVVAVTAERPSVATHLSVVPEQPLTQPPTSNLNIAAGETRTALAVVPVGTDGSIRVYNHAGYIRLTVDILGYVEQRPDETRAGRVVPMSSPFRSFDTRQAQWGAATLGPLQAERWSFDAFAASVNVSGVAVGRIGSLIGNLTIAALGRQTSGVDVTSRLAAYPYEVGGSVASGSNISMASNLGAIANMTFVALGVDRQVAVHNRAGYAHYLLDVSAVVLAD